MQCKACQHPDGLLPLGGSVQVCRECGAELRVPAVETLDGGRHGLTPAGADEE
jgi:hypothetical protein